MTVEPKPPWREVPTSVRRQAAAVLGADIRRAVRLWGGYAPSATFRLFLSDGRRVVFKGIGDLDADGLRNSGFTDDEIERQRAFMRQVLEAELRVYEEVGALLLPWAPGLHGTIRESGWLAMVLEDVGPPQVPPWTADLARAALVDYAAFHASTLGRPDLPAWLPREAHHSFARRWRRLLDDPAGVDSLAQLAGERAGESSAWLERHAATLTAAAERLIDAPAPHALVHHDTRSDNVRIQPGGRLRIFDWPYAAVGPHEFDVVAFAQSITTEGGPPPEQCMRWYAEHIQVREDAERASIAAIAGFFAEAAWRPPIPGVPRVRSIQRRQLRTSLAWAARALELERPGWLERVPD